jgi:hypothetical protein
MSPFTSLPKELRLQIWALAYFAEPPRLVALQTKPHDESHGKDFFCPRYSPSPAPTIVNVCHEARVEAHFQAEKARHLVRHHVGLFPATPETMYTEEYYFRFSTDILYIPLADQHTAHFDDSPDVGFLPHFRRAVGGCDPFTLRNVAITKVMWNGVHDGSVSNSLREFPCICRFVMLCPDEDRLKASRRNPFVRSAYRIVTLYRMDVRQQAGDMDLDVYIDVDFATLEEGRLRIIPKREWGEWNGLGCEWVEKDAVAKHV